MKHINVKSSTYIEFIKYPKFEIGNHIRLSKYENVFAKGYTPNWSEVFVIKKLKYCSVDIHNSRP